MKKLLLIAAALTVFIAVPAMAEPRSYRHDGNTVCQRFTDRNGHIRRVCHEEPGRYQQHRKYSKKDRRDRMVQYRNDYDRDMRGRMVHYRNDYDRDMRGRMMYRNDYYDRGRWNDHVPAGGMVDDTYRYRRY